MLDAARFNAEFLPKVPQAATFAVEAEVVGDGFARLTMPPLAHPGGVAGRAALLALADVAVWAAVMARVGALEMAVTTNLSASFLREPEGTTIAEVRVVGITHGLAMATATLSTATGETVATVTSTYAVP